MLAAIHDSKLSYCDYGDGGHASYDAIARDEASMAAAVGEARAKRPGAPVVIRLMTDRHIPDDPARAVARRMPGKAAVPFAPFVHVEVAEGGARREVLRSHWTGGIADGRFSADHGRVSDKLATLVVRLVDNYARRGNWRGYSWVDEMRASAVAQLASVALRFDEGRGNNPFAFYTQIASNVFKRVVNAERRQRDIADELLMAAGAAPSFSRQVAHAMGHDAAA